MDGKQETTSSGWPKKERHYSSAMAQPQTRGNGISH
jgi:hypothetical protein